MNKLFIILALLAFAPANVRAESYINDGSAFVIAKAVKLGRGNAYSVSANANLNTGAGKTEIATKVDCDANCSKCDTTTGTCSACLPGRYLSNNLCLSCSGISVANGSCSACSGSNNCTAVTCNSGYYKTGSGSCGACTAGQYVSGGNCISCPTGTYSTGSNQGSCQPCSNIRVSIGSNQYTSCSDCTATGTCTSYSCPAGYYAKRSGGCEKCPTGCSACNEYYCTACSSGYTLGSGSNQNTSYYGKCLANSGSESNSSSGSGSGSNTGSNGGSSGGGSSTCPSGQTYRTNVRTCSSNSYTYTGCVASDYGTSCSSSSQCSTGRCAPCYDSSGKWVPQGSTCR